MKEEYQALISQLEGHRCWGILIGTAGMTFEIGSQLEQEGTVCGDFSIWIQTRFRIVASKMLVLQAEYPSGDHLSTLVSVLDGQVIVRASIDPLDHSLRLLIGESHLLSAFPEPSDKEMDWTLFVNKPQGGGYLVAHEDCFKGPLTASAGGGI